MSDIPHLPTYKRRRQRQQEIEAQAVRIGLSLKTINWLMAELRLMASDGYQETK